ncbi:hypothetical protein Q7P37_007456 [Cladosporium fusiforme]
MPAPIPAFAPTVRSAELDPVGAGWLEEAGEDCDSWSTIGLVSEPEDGTREGVVFKTGALEVAVLDDAVLEGDVIGMAISGDVVSANVVLEETLVDDIGLAEDDVLEELVPGDAMRDDTELGVVLDLVEDVGVVDDVLVL